MYSDEIRSIVVEKLNEGISVSEINNKYKISKKNIHNLYRNYQKEQLTLVRELIKDNKLEEALIICQKKEFLNYPAMLSCQIKILILQNKINELLKLSIREDLINNETIQSQIIKELINKNCLLKAKEICERESFFNSETIQILRKKILIKQENIKNSVTNEKISTLTIINTIDIRPDSEKCVGNSLQNKVKPKNKINNSKKRHNKENLIKNLFEKEVLQIGAYLYSQTGKIELQKNAIEALDNFQLLIEKPVTDKDALKRIMALLEKVKDNGIFDININKKRYIKYKK